jgi:hypothetical protein
VSKATYSYNLQTNIINKRLPALNLVEDVLSTNETVEIVWDWVGMFKKLIDVTDREFGVLLIDMIGAEAIVNSLGGIACHEISMLQLVSREM